MPRGLAEVAPLARSDAGSGSGCDILASRWAHPRDPIFHRPSDPERSANGWPAFSRRLVTLRGLRSGPPIGSTRRPSRLGPFSRFLRTHRLARTRGSTAGVVVCLRRAFALSRSSGNPGAPSAKLDSFSLGGSGSKRRSRVQVLPRQRSLSGDPVPQKEGCGPIEAGPRIRLRHRRCRAARRSRR